MSLASSFEINANRVSLTAEQGFDASERRRVHQAAEIGALWSQRTNGRLAEGDRTADELFEVSFDRDLRVFFIYSQTFSIFQSFAKRLACKRRARVATTHRPRSRALPRLRASEDDRQLEVLDCKSKTISSALSSSQISFQFGQLFEPLLNSYNATVSTASMDELGRTSMLWIDNSCSLMEVRPGERKRIHLRSDVKSFDFSRFEQTP